MPIVKGTTIRRKVLDGCLSSDQHYTLLELMDKCNEALRQHGHTKLVSSENTIRTDLKQLEELYPEAKVVSSKVGRNVYYRYKNKGFSIFKTPLTNDEIIGLTQTLAMLSRFEGMPGQVWFNKLVERLRPTLQIDASVTHVVGFDDNIDLKGREHYTPLLKAIVERQVLLVRYVNYKNPIEYSIIFHPYYIKQYNNRWFVFGWNEEKQRISNLAFDRILEFTTIIRKYRPNDEIDFFEYFDDMIGVSREITDEPQEVQLWVSDAQLPYILSKPLHGTQRIIDKVENGSIISIKLILNYELEQTILGFGEKVKVLKPDSLVTRISERIKSASSLY